MNVQFHWVGGATFILSIDDVKIAVDPVLCTKGTIQDFFWFKTTRIENPQYENRDFENIDLWLITHSHEDHLDEIGLSKISPKSTIVCNKNAKKYVNEVGLQKLTVLKWGDEKRIIINDIEISITAIPAIHGVNPISAFVAGNVNGYYLKIIKGDEVLGVYITGDTVYKAKTIKSLDCKKIDLMIPNMGAAMQNSWIMTLTLDAQMLKKMITKLNPKIVIPVHFGTFEHYRESIDKTRLLQDARIKILPVGSKVKIIEI